MAKPTEEQRVKLTFPQIQDATPDGWALIMDVLKVRYRTRTFATGLEFVNRVGALAEQLDHHPDVSLTYTDVILTVKSHDVNGITSRDIDFARGVAEIAASMSLEADVAGLNRLDIGLDVQQQPEGLAPFYAALFGSEINNGEPVDASGQMPTMWWQAPASMQPAENAEYALPEQDHEQRWHFDVWVAPGSGPTRLQEVLDAGGTLVSDKAAPEYWVVEDADGNRHCICTSERV